MAILALDTSSKRGSVALMVNEKIVSSAEMSQSANSAAELSLRIKALFDQSESQLSNLEHIVLNTGPGSFTGLRVGVVTAKVLAFSIGCTVKGLNTLQTLAAGALEQSAENRVCVILDAQRRQLFAGRFQRDQPWNPSALGEIQIIERNQLKSFAQGDPVVAGERLFDQLVDVSFLSDKSWECSANWVAHHGSAKNDNPPSEDFWSLKPEYFRASAAEEKRNERLIK